MPQGFLNNYGATNVLETYVTYGGQWVHLNTDSVPMMASDSTSAGYVEPTFLGYGPFPVPGGDFVMSADSTGSTATINFFVNWHFFASAHPPVVIYGWWMSQGQHTDDILWQQNFDTPVTVSFSTGGNLQFSTLSITLESCTASPPPPPPPPPTGPWVTGQSLGSLTDYSGYTVGVAFTVGASPITVTSLGKWCVAGDSANYIMGIYDTAGVTQYASVSFNAAGGAPGTYQYITLGSPVVLSAGVQYVLSCAVVSGGLGANYDTGTSITVTAAATGDGYAFTGYGSGFPFGAAFTIGGGATADITPLNFLYHL